MWRLAAIPLALGIPAITMTVGTPTLPPALAAACVVTTLLGLAVALLPGRWAAERPLDLMWLVSDGVGLMPALLFLRVVELPDCELSVSVPAAWLFAVGRPELSPAAIGPSPARHTSRVSLHQHGGQLFCVQFGHSASCADRGDRHSLGSDQLATLAMANQKHVAISRAPSQVQSLGGLVRFQFSDAFFTVKRRCSHTPVQWIWPASDDKI